MTAVIDNGTLIIKDVGSHYASLTASGKLKWDKKTQSLRGVADLELLELLADIIELPKEIEKEYRKMQEVKLAVDRARLEEEPKPLARFPIKANLLKHQIRGANMALLVFGVIEPEEFNRRAGVYDENECSM